MQSSKQPPQQRRKENAVTTPANGATNSSNTAHARKKNALSNTHDLYSPSFPTVLTTCRACLPLPTVLTTCRACLPLPTVLTTCRAYLCLSDVLTACRACPAILTTCRVPYRLRVVCLFLLSLHHSEGAFLRRHNNDCAFSLSTLRREPLYDQALSPRFGRNSLRAQQQLRKCATALLPLRASEGAH